MTSSSQHGNTGTQPLWNLIRQDYTLRLSLVAHEWVTEHLKAWNAVFAEGRKRGNSAYFGPALVEMEIADAEKRAEWSYRTCCEIWEIQGRAKCRPFFRAIFDSCLQPMFSVREGCFMHGLGLHQKRAGTRISHNLSAISSHLRREMERLRARWNTILEIATRDAENEERLQRERDREQKARTYEEIRTRKIFEYVWGSGEPSVPADARPVARTLGSSFTWKELEVRFREIQAKTSPRQNVQAVFIRTEWDSDSIGEVWIVSGNVALQKEFEYLGSIAAQKLGYALRDDVHKDWLVRLREWMHQTGLDKDKDFAWCPTGHVKDGESIGTTHSLVLEKVAELSAKFCISLLARGTPESTGSQPPEYSETVGSQSGQPRPTRKSKTKKQLRRMAVIFGAIQSGLKGHKYCSALDHRKLRLPNQWIEDGCPGTYTQAYRDARWRKRIQDEKCRHRKQYDKTPTQQREAIIQDENGARRTRR